MRKWLIISTIGTLALLSPLGAFAQYGAPPSAAPSTYYILPGQTLTFAGYHFAPGELVDITGPGGLIASTIAGPSGSFIGAGAYVVPFAYEHSTQTFYVGGIPLRIVVGTFYPNLTPTSYYVAPGQEMGATATGFAPGETIALYVNGTFVVEGPANSRGGLYFYFPAPAAGSKFTIEAVGLSSETYSLRTISLW